MTNHVSRHLGLVGSCVKKFRSPYIGPDDLHQMGVVGLIKAVGEFDLTPGYQFPTYACTVIRNEMTGESLRIGKERARMDGVEWEDFTSEYSRSSAQGRGGCAPADMFTHLLSKQQQEVINLRFGFNRSDAQSLHAVAMVMGCSHETMRRTEKLALISIRKHLYDGLYRNEGTKAIGTKKNIAVGHVKGIRR